MGAIGVLLRDGQNLLINLIEPALLAGQVSHQVMKGQAVRIQAVRQIWSVTQ